MIMDFIAELQWRGMLQDYSPGIEEEFAKGSVSGYIGFDPTAPSLTIGNYVQIMLLSLLQRAGHRPVVLMGGATGRIGDPSGKDKERDLKSYDELDNNLNFQVEQMKKFFDFEGPNAVRMVNNLDFYRDMDVLTFLRDVGKTLTINYMMSKESVQRRLETGISYTEFSYQLLQAYDFQRLYHSHGCILQMGGSDQWGNITSGTEFIRRNLGAKAYGLTTPLLTKADGSKFGKSTEGNIWLDSRLTSPYKFYQFWINADDRDLPKFMRYFSFKNREEIEALEAQHADNPRALKEILAEELTVRIHSAEDFRAVQQVSHLLFNARANEEDLRALTPAVLDTVAEEIPCFRLPKELVAQTPALLDLLAGLTTICSSKGDARRAVQGKAVSVNKMRIESPEATIAVDQWLHGRYLMIENGKKNKYLLVADQE